MVKYDIFISDTNIILKGIKKYDIKNLVIIKEEINYGKRSCCFHKYYMSPLLYS
ncbi:hypothetical protein EDD79_101121 [Serpentinicella alkaliphila]|uniref:Uncharacterized protein n=1 Tax=Serpentinicella alkaliphila TaxID=1734049 RepID=A0A4R2THU1_9FIRM|nr:hypothetical protein EDD79_101121 [Serpentinicella alkaliphila]